MTFGVLAWPSQSLEAACVAHPDDWDRPGAGHVGVARQALGAWLDISTVFWRLDWAGAGKAMLEELRVCNEGVGDLLGLLSC